MMPRFKNNAMEMLCFESLLGLAIDAKSMRVLMKERKTTAWEQSRMSQIYFGAALRTPIGDVGTISLASLDHLSSAFEILPFCAISYFARAVQNCADETDSITLVHCIALLRCGKSHFVSSRAFRPSRSQRVSVDAGRADHESSLR